MKRATMGIALAAAAIILVPLSLLFVYPHGTFNVEWGDSLWVIAYERAYIASHYSFPAIYNFAGHVGVPRPIFYGPLLYPILGLIGEVFESSGAVRVLSVALWLLQCLLVYRLTRVIGRNVIEGLIAAAMVSWSVYSLTNLYNRGALAEFFGTGFLFCAIAAGGLALLEPTHRRRVGFALLGALCAAMAIGSHGPTALVGGSLLILLAAASIPLRRFTLTPSPGTPGEGRGEGLPSRVRTADQSPGRSAMRTLRAQSLFARLSLAVLILAVVSPWVYVASQFSGRLSIQVDAEEFPTPQEWHRLASNDSVWARFKPLPLAEKDGVTDPNTPYLDATWNFPLAMLAFWNAGLAFSKRGYSRFRPLMIWSAIGAAVLLAISVSPWLQDALPRRIPATVQFPYRLVGHANILLFTLLIAAWGVRSSRSLSPRLLRADRLVLIAACLLSAAGLGIKLDHAAIVAVADGAAQFDAGNESGFLTDAPEVYVGQNDFTLYVPGRTISPAERASAAKVDAPRGLGPEEEFQETHFDLPEKRWMVSSVLNFPWDRLIVDGRPIPFDQVHNLYFHQAVELPAGPHTFGFEFEPDPVWVWLNRLSWTLLAFLAVVTAAFFVDPFKERKRRAEGRHK